VLVARGDMILFSKAYGSANLEWNIPNTATTKFRIASVTKQFTAAATLLLEERGKLRIDEPVRTYHPDAPAAWDKITLFHLLAHTSGIPDYTTLSEYDSLRTIRTTPKQLVRRFRDRALDFAPGTQMRYSNSGYVLLGAILEKTSGASYAQFVQENIFTPLGMKDSGYDSSSTIIARRAAGYEASRNGPVNARYLDMSIPFAAGALCSTTEDLLRWQRALFGGKVLSAASMKKMTTPVRSNYALGLSSQASRPRSDRARRRHRWLQVPALLLSRQQSDHYRPIKYRAPGVDRIAKKLGLLVHGEAVAP
jgi:CubicO group peptidase (beta-lactamase class C family)